ncbi:cytochrome c oxidase assembly protein [Methylobacter svalbardensis]|uniref:cytochrome c oxidase assembly protein n=1 Tax=Methylobacter svalbardensis TaxID=3080016 RepID=UPI003BB510B0
MNPLQWLVPWETSFFIVIVTAVTAMLFIRGCLRCRLLFRQKLYFGAGLLSMYIVTHTQVDYYAEHAFFVHQFQSLVLHHLGPFFIVLASLKMCCRQLYSLITVSFAAHVVTMILGASSPERPDYPSYCE